MKFFSLLMVAMAFSLNAIADNKVSIEDFTIVPGEEQTIAVALDNSDPISSLQMDVTFPEGLEYVNKSVSKNAERLKIHSIGAPELASGATRFIILHEAEDITKSAFVGNTGTIFTFKVKASSNYKGGKIEVANVEGSDGTLAEPVAHEMESFSVKAKAFAGTFSVSTNNISINLQKGDVAMVDISVANAFNIAGVQADFELPENLVIEEIIKGSRIPENYNPKPSTLETSGTVTLSSLIFEEFEGNDGVVFSLKLKAKDEVKGQLVVKNMIATDKTGATAFEIDGEEAIDVEFFYVYYKNNISAGSNGTVTVSATEALAGDVVSLAITPELFYEIENLSVTYGAENTPVEVAEDFTFIMPEGDVNISVTFVGPTKPEAPELTATSALVTDGSVAQYLYNVEAKAFLIGGNDWGTRASYSATNGYPVKLTLNEDGATYTFNDQLPNGNWNSLDCQGVDQIWVDGAGRGGDKMWTVTVAEDGSFTIANSNVPNGSLSVVPSKAGDTRLYISDAEEAQDVWVAVSEEEYKAYIEKYSKYQSALDEYNKKFYEVGDDITFIAPATWEGQSGSYGGLANPAAERYNGGGSVEAGDVLTQTVTGLKNGTYEVTLGLAASYTSGRGFECPTGDGLSVGFANEAEAGITVVETGWVSEGQQAVVTLTATVADGTLKYGIKNLAPSGNWYVAQVVSIVYAAEPVVPIHTIDFTTQTSYPYYNMGAPEGSSFDVIDGALVIENTAERTNPWDLQPFICDWFSLKAGYDYVVRITMKASADGSAQLNMGTWSAAMYQQLAFTASEEYKTYDVAFPNSTVESSGNDVHVLFQGGKYIGKVEIAKVEIFEYAPEPEPTEATYTIDVERYPGLGYGVTAFTPDFTEALAFLGIEDVTAATLVGINADGSEEAAPGPGGIDGWCNAEGTFVGWGDNSKICVKFFPSVPQYEICDMNGADVVGTTYTVKYALKANDKTAIFAINVKFVEKPVVALTYADLTNKKDVAVELTSELGMVYEGLTADVDVAAILAELGAESLNDVTVYAVQSDGTLDDSYKLGTTDGWRNAEGDWQSWGADAFLCVKADFSLEAGQIYYVGGMDGNTTEPGAYTATYAFVNEAKEAVTLKVTLTYPAAPDAWFTEGMFKVNDYVDGMKMAVADPRYVVDPTDASNGCIIVTSNDAPANDYDAQLFISTAEPLNEGDVFTLTMKVRADREQSGAATQSHTAPGSYIHWDAVGQISFTTEWVEFTKTVTVNSSMATMNTIAINLSDMTGKAANNFYFDDIKLEVAVPDAIEDVEIAAPANGKFIENGQVVIIKNGVKYSVSGSIIR